MVFLGLDFIISSLALILVCSYILYIYREQVFRFFYKKNNFNLFIRNIKQYLDVKYPKIKFDFKIVEDSKPEENPQTRCYLVINNLVLQYTNYELDTSNTNLSIQHNQLWNSYTFNSRPSGNKLPDDWAKRKNIAYQRDHGNCQRCGTHTKIETAHLYIVKPIEDGGQYYLENLITLCRDCDKITTNSNLKYLDIMDKLNSFVK